MTKLSILVFALLAVLASAISVQENYTICSWARLRAGVIRDTVYLDGGELWWQTAFVDGTTPVTSSDGNVEGYMYTLNFSTSFNTATTNLSALFQTLPKAEGAANNIAPNYIDGTMFVNDDELYLYGGLPRLTNSSSPQAADSVLGYEAFQYGPYRQNWQPGFYQGSLPSEVTRYLTNGGGVSAPSENLGFYFSGMRAPEWGPIYYDDDSANTTANTLIEVDMSVMRQEGWTNTTLPSNIPPRANAELVWVPVSSQGVLVAIGGVNPPEEIFAVGLNASQTAESEAQSPGFMTSLPIYDIASKTWYLQSTTGTPPGQLTGFCSVVATSNDSSSFNVYIYGGYDGLNADDEPEDDVWILSIPAFTWIKAYSGSSGHGRSGHRCVKPYPDQMFTIGGVHQNQAQCVADGIIQVFNLNTLQFQDVYDPTIWSDYKVPTAVSTIIGGNAQGGATKTASWSDGSLSSIFGTKYEKAIATYYPYPTNDPSLPTPSSSPGSTPHQGGGLPKWVAPFLGVVLGLLFLFIVFGLCILFRRRKLLSRNSTGGSSTSGSKTSRIIRWVNGMPSGLEQKESPSLMQADVEETHYHSTPLAGELGGRPRYELEAEERSTPPPVEMATPYHFQEHPSYPRSIDHPYGAAASHSASTLGRHELDIETPLSAPSPYIPPHGPDDVGNSSSRYFDPISEQGSTPQDSLLQSSSSNQDQGKPPKTLTPGLALTPGLVTAGKNHTRNESSVSSESSQAAARFHPVSPEEERKTSSEFANRSKNNTHAMSGSGNGRESPNYPDNWPLVSPMTPVAPSRDWGNPKYATKKGGSEDTIEE